VYTYDTDRVNELLLEAEGADEKELRELLVELGEIAIEAIDNAADEHDEKSIEPPERELALAKAVYDFADWQFGGYEDRDETTRRVVGRQLWSEVSDRVRTSTGATPKAPAFGSSEHDSE